MAESSLGAASIDALVVLALGVAILLLSGAFIATCWLWMTLAAGL